MDDNPEFIWTHFDDEIYHDPRIFHKINAFYEQYGFNEVLEPFVGIVATTMVFLADSELRLIYSGIEPTPTMESFTIELDID